MNEDLELLLKMAKDYGRLSEKADKVYINQHGTYRDKKAISEFSDFGNTYYAYKSTFYSKYKIETKKQTFLQTIKSWFWVK